MTTRGNLEFALQRFARLLLEQHATTTATAIDRAVASVRVERDAAIETHSGRNQFVHGVGPLYVAKTRNPSQYPDWSEIQNKPAGFGGSIDPSTLELDGSQITTGQVPLLRLPVAAPGEISPHRLVRADDPRLHAESFAMISGEPLAAGDFVRVTLIGGQARCVRADASLGMTGAAIGFVSTACGTNDQITVFPQGANALCYLPGVTVSDLGTTVFLSTMPGKASLTPPATTGQLLQPLGTVTGIVSGTVAVVLVRYEFRYLL